jgi:hypothetical protein
LIDDGELPADLIGRVIRLHTDDAYVEASRIVPDTLGYLYDEAS